MNNTRAADVIIHALWPGPGVVVMTLGAPLVTYASRSATRCARSGAAGGGVSANATLTSKAINETSNAAIAIDQVRALDIRISKSFREKFERVGVCVPFAAILTI